MNISIEFEYLLSPVPLAVSLSIADSKKYINLQHLIKNLSIDFNLPVPNSNQKLVLSLGTDNFGIVRHPLSITKITLDDFYQRNEFCFRGHTKFDQKFLDYAKKKKIYLDQTVNNSNRLDFVGQLDLVFEWPVWKNLLK